MRHTLAAFMLLAVPATAATVTVNPPAYTVDQPAYTANPPPFTVNPPAFTITVPDGSGKQGVAGPAGPAGPMGPAGPAGSGAAVDLGPLTARVQALETALKALGTTTPPVTTTPPASTTLADPCVGRTDKWTALTIKPTESIKLSLACAAPNFKMTLMAGTYLYPSVNFNLPASFGTVEIAGAGAGLTKLDGGGGCTTNNNSAGSCATRLAYGNGVVRTETSLYIHDLEITGGGTAAAGSHDLQAGLYMAVANGTVTAERVMFRRNQNGVAGNASFFTNSVVNIKSSDFVENSTDGGSHDYYISGAGSTINVTDSNFYGSLHGNNGKSRVPFVNHSGGYNKSLEGRTIECADGCKMTVKGGVYGGSSISQNIFGNGTESISMGAGDTIITGGAWWMAPRSQLMSNAGSFNASGVTVTCANGGSISNDKGTPLTGFACGAANDNPPAVPAYVSGAK